MLILVFGAGLAALTATSPIRPLPSMRQGQSAPADIVSPADVQIEDTETTEGRRRAAADDVLPVYSYDPNVFLDAEDKVRRFFAMGRQSGQTGSRDYAGLQKMVYDRFGIELGTADLEALDKAGFGADLESALVNILEKYSSPGLLLSKSLVAERDPEKGEAVLRRANGERNVRLADLLDVREAKSRIVQDVNALELTARKKGLLISLAYGFLAPNITYNKVETESRRANARSRVEPVFSALPKGRIILRKGEEATADTVKRIAAVNQFLRPSRTWPAALGAFLLFSLLLTALWFYLLSLQPFRTAWKYFLMSGLTLGLALLLDRLGASLAGAATLNARFFLFQSAESAAFAIPFQFGVLLFAFLTTNAAALMFAVLGSLLAGYLLGANLMLAIYGLVGGIAAIYGIKHYRKARRTSVLKAGLFVVAPVNMLLGLILFLLQGRAGGWETLAANVFMALLGGILGAGLAFVLLPIYETIFRFLTQSKLLELTNSESAPLPPAGPAGARLLPPLAGRGPAGREGGRGDRCRPPAGQGGGALPRHRQDQDARVLHREPGPEGRRPQGPDPQHEHAGHRQPRQGGRGAGPQGAPAGRDPGDRRTAPRHFAGPLLLPQSQGEVRPRDAQGRRRDVPLPRPHAPDPGSRAGHAGRRGRGGLAQPQDPQRGQPQAGHPRYLRQLSCRTASWTTAASRCGRCGPWPTPSWPR